jgi:single-stranded-DNA-specific exonuclease
LLKNISPNGQPRVMKEKHLSLEIRQDKHTARAIWFNGALDPLPKAPWDIAFELVRNEYQGRVQPQIQIRALRAASVS